MNVNNVIHQMSSKGIERRFIDMERGILYAIFLN